MVLPQHLIDTSPQLVARAHGLLPVAQGGCCQPSMENPYCLLLSTTSMQPLTFKGIHFCTSDPIIICFLCLYVCGSCQDSEAGICWGDVVECPLTGRGPRRLVARHKHTTAGLGQTRHLALGVAAGHCSRCGLAQELVQNGLCAVGQQHQRPDMSVKGLALHFTFFCSNKN